MKHIIETYFKKVGDADQIRYLLASRDRDESNIVLGLILFNILNEYPSINYELINNSLDLSFVTEMNLTKLNLSFKDDRLCLLLKLGSLSLFNKRKEADPVIINNILKILTALGFISEEEKYYTEDLKSYTFKW